MRLFVGIAVACLLLARPADAIDVTRCGQAIGPGQVGELRFDLGCLLDGVRLEPGATLRLNGFTLSGNGTGSGVSCTTKRCTIEGPGEIRGFWAGVNCGGCRVVARDVAVRENLEGIYIPLSGTLVAERVVASDNAGSGIWAQAVKGSDIQASRNGANGVSAHGRLRIRRLDATDNAGWGVVGPESRSRLVDATVTGNDGAGDGFDIVSTGRMRLRRTTCGRSARIRYVSQEEYKIVGSFGCADDRRAP